MGWWWEKDTGKEVALSKEHARRNGRGTRCCAGVEEWGEEERKGKERRREMEIAKDTHLGRARGAECRRVVPAAGARPAAPVGAAGDRRPGRVDDGVPADKPARVEVREHRVAVQRADHELEREVGLEVGEGGELCVRGAE